MGGYLSSGKRSVFGFFAFSIVFFLAQGVAWSQTAVTPSGLGMQAWPYQISQLGHLVWMSKNVSSSSGMYYTMVADIDASATATWNGGAGFMPIGMEDGGPFLGTFDGGGHTIRGLVINCSSTTGDVGMFGYIGPGSVVKNIGLVGGSVTGDISVGGLVGFNYSGTVADAYTMMSVTGTQEVGGLIGTILYGSVSNSYATGAVWGNYSVGGLIGLSDSGAVSNVYSIGNVTGTDYNVGGLMGMNSSCSVQNSYWDIETSGQSTSAGGTGMTTAQMKQQAMFVDWDFARVWVINETVIYPQLRTFIISGDANLDRAVNVSDLSLLAANYGMSSGATWSKGDFTGDGAVNVSDLSLLAANYGMGSTSTLSWADAYAHAFGTTDGSDVETETTSADSDSEASTDVVSFSACSSLGLSLIAVILLMGLMFMKQEE